MTPMSEKISVASNASSEADSKIVKADPSNVSSKTYSSAVKASALSPSGSPGTPPPPAPVFSDHATVAATPLLPSGISLEGNSSPMLGNKMSSDLASNNSASLGRQCRDEPEPGSLDDSSSSWKKAKSIKKKKGSADKPNSAGKGQSNRGPSKVPHARLCHFCRKPDHIVSECPTAPLCTKCNRRGHEQASCETLDPSKPPLSRKERLERKAKEVNKNKRVWKEAAEKTYVGKTATQAIEAAPLILVSPNTTLPKVSDDDNPGGMNLVSGEEEEEDADDSSSEEEQERARPENMPGLLVHYKKLSTQFSSYGLPSLREVAMILVKNALIYTVKTIMLNNLTLPLKLLPTPLALAMSLAVKAFLAVVPLKKIAAVATVLNTGWELFSACRKTTQVVLKMTSNYLGTSPCVDLRNDVQQVNKSKHTEQHNYQATFSWEKVDPNGSIGTSTPVPTRCVLSDDGSEPKNHIPSETLLPPPPKDFVYSSEACAQFIGPGILDLTSTVDEVVTRVNYSLRNIYSVNSDRFSAIRGHRPVEDAAIAASIIIAHERWSKNALNIGAAGIAPLN